MRWENAKYLELLVDRLVRERGMDATWRALRANFVTTVEGPWGKRTLCCGVELPGALHYAAPDVRSRLLSLLRDHDPSWHAPLQ